MPRQFRPGDGFLDHREAEYETQLVIDSIPLTDNRSALRSRPTTKWLGNRRSTRAGLDHEVLRSWMMHDNRGRALFGFEQES
jgi:hypothetical protein